MGAAAALWGVTDCCEAQLVQAARRGDKAAFGQLLARHLPLAQRLAERVLHEPERARDAAQEAAVLALVGLDRLLAPERFGAWLGGIALNVARRSVRRAQAVTGLPDDIVDPAPGPEEAAAAALLGETVRAAVADLAPGQRDAVYLFYLQGLTHREVAAELDISVGAVKARLHQGRAALATLLEAERFEERDMTESVNLANVVIDGVRRGDEGRPGRRSHVVKLREIDGGRLLFIWIGEAEAIYLALALESVQMPRPGPYQFAATLLDGTGSNVQEVRISRLEGSIYYAAAVLDGPSGRRTVDARPSDVLNLAALTGVPIRVETGLFTEPEQFDWPERYSVGMTEVVADARAMMTRPRDID